MLTVRGLTVLMNMIPDLMIMVLLIMVAHTTIIPRHPIGITLPTNIGRSSSPVHRPGIPGVPTCDLGVVSGGSRFHRAGGRSSDSPSGTRSSVQMKPEEQTEEESILAFTVSDEALEHAANTNFSLGNCTDARMCQAPNDRPCQPK